jgi:hypothetical protein
MCPHKERLQRKRTLRRRPMDPISERQTMWNTKPTVPATTKVVSLATAADIANSDEIPPEDVVLGLQVPHHEELLQRKRTLRRRPIVPRTKWNYVPATIPAVTNVVSRRSITTEALRIYTIAAHVDTVLDDHILFIHAEECLRHTYTHVPMLITRKCSSSNKMSSM